MDRHLGAPVILAVLLNSTNIRDDPRGLIYSHGLIPRS